MTHTSPRRLDKVWTFFAPLVVVFLGSDQLSKEWAALHLEPGSTTELGFALTFNTKGAFSMDLPLPLLYFLTIAILGFGTYLVIKNKLWQDRWHLAGLALLLSGALGNFIDRVRLGYVIDFIKVYWWPTFNLADVWIVLGVLIFAWEFLFRENDLEKL